jgi:spermidine dehydrogenase
LSAPSQARPTPARCTIWSRRWDQRGLAAAVFQKKGGGRCLVIDNHAIFGGEAKRNEFTVDGHPVAHQGSAIFLVPQKGGWPPTLFTI